MRTYRACNGGACVGVIAEFRTASGGGGACVGVACTQDVAFKKVSSSHDCVSVGYPEGGVVVMDSKDPDGPHLHFPEAEWDDGWLLKHKFTGIEQALVPQRLAAVWLERNPGAGDQPWYMLADDDRDALYFTQAEITAYLKGVSDGIFAVEVTA